MNFDDELREALNSYDPPRRTDFDLSQAIALAARTSAESDGEAPPTIAEVSTSVHRHRRPKRNRVAAGAVALAIAAVIGIVFVARNSASNPTTVADALGLHGPRTAKSTSGVDPHEASARAEAKKLLEAFVPPQGASPTSNAAPLDAQQMPPSSSNVIELSRSWLVPGDAAALAAQLTAAPPPEMQVIGAGNSAVDASDKSAPPPSHGFVLAPSGAPMSGFDAVLAPGIKGSLQLSMVDLGDGNVLLRADAVTRWTRSRSAAEQLPTGPQRLAIAHDMGMNADNTIHRRVVSDKEMISQVASLLDGLEPGSSRGVFCAWGDGAHFDLTFAARLGGSPVASAVVNANGCREATITINGRTTTHYPGSEALIALLKRLDP